MTQLNLPAYEFRIRGTESSPEIFDDIRKKFVALTPEEWVRQNLIRYLTADKRYPATLIAVEMPLDLGGTVQRSDVVLYQPSGKPLLIVECKAPEVEINQQVFDQVAAYNTKIGAEYILVSNGLRHFCCRSDAENKRYVFLKEIPSYDEIMNGQH